MVDRTFNFCGNNIIKSATVDTTRSFVNDPKPATHTIEEASYHSIKSGVKVIDCKANIWISRRCLNFLNKVSAGVRMKWKTKHGSVIVSLSESN